MKTGVEDILRCPVSAADLALLARADLQLLKAGIQSGRLRHLNGAPVRLDLEAALATPDRGFVYPVVNGIFVLLPGMAIVDGSGPVIPAETDIGASTEAVMRFYDEVGWKKTDDNTYADAQIFEDLRPVSQEYIHMCHMRLRQHFPKRGTYLLDVASGPIQYPEYLTYSEGYERRLCADVSFAALEGAKQKLGECGVYIQCDIQHLPIKDRVVDGFVSLHTLYHVPAQGQRRAFLELLRVLKDEGRGVVVYSWGSRSLLMRLLMPGPGRLRGARQVMCQLVRRLMGRANAAGPQSRPGAVGGATARGAVALPDTGIRPGFYAHDYAWYRRELAPVCNTEISCWRSVSVPFLKRYIRPGSFGRRFLRALFWLESSYPRFFGRYGQYPAMTFKRPTGSRGPGQPTVGDGRRLRSEVSQTSAVGDQR